MKIEELNQDNREQVQKLSSDVLFFLESEIKISQEYSLTNIALNVLLGSIFKIIYSIIPIDKRENVLEMISEQLRHNFIENDKLQKDENT